jgi:hypothetical protein
MNENNKIKVIIQHPILSFQLMNWENPATAAYGHGTNLRPPYTASMVSSSGSPNSYFGVGTCYFK